jgi:hypothetical protein
MIIKNTYKLLYHDLKNAHTNNWIKKKFQKYTYMGSVLLILF